MILHSIQPPTIDTGSSLLSRFFEFFSFHVGCSEPSVYDFETKSFIVGDQSLKFFLTIGTDGPRRQINILTHPFGKMEDMID